jgi:hypothetical protein
MQSTIRMRMNAAMPAQTPFDLRFTSRKATAWDGLWPSCKRMLEGIGLQEALQSWDFPQPGSNRG